MSMRPGDLINAEDVVPYPHRRQIPREGSPVTTYALVAPGKPHAWAIVACVVAGWRCLATGEMPDKQDTDAVVTALTDNFGVGQDYLPRDLFVLRGSRSLDVHLRRATGESLTYCGGSASNPYVHVQGRYFQHCIKCTTAYRAENFGRHPFMEF